jgi:predicted O-methyltransferase YrrM
LAGLIQQAFDGRLLPNLGCSDGPNPPDRQTAGVALVSARQDIVAVLYAGQEPFAGLPAGAHKTDMQGWHSQHPYLTRAIDAVRPRVIAEIGVWKGGSVITMAQRLKELGLDGVVVAIDTWLGSAEHYLATKHHADLNFRHGYPQLYYTFAANIHDRGLQDYVVPLPLDSLNAFEVLKAKGIRPDVLHIDAGHDFESVTRDLEVWWPLLAPGGVLIGDDYHGGIKWPGLKWPGVRKAFDEFFARHKHTLFESGDAKCYVGKPR